MFYDHAQKRAAPTRLMTAPTPKAVEMLTRSAPLLEPVAVVWELAAELEALDVAEVEPAVAPLPPVVAAAVLPEVALAPETLAVAQLVELPAWTVMISEYAVAPVPSFRAILKFVPAWRSTIQVYEVPFWLGNCIRGVADGCPAGTRDR